MVSISISKKSSKKATKLVGPQKSFERTFTSGHRQDLQIVKRSSKVQRNIGRMINE